MYEDNDQSSNEFWRWGLGDLWFWLLRCHYLKANFVTILTEVSDIINRESIQINKNWFIFQQTILYPWKV